MQKNADRLGVGELYGLFACMVTGRSWNSIRKGIDKSEKNAAEVIFLLCNLHIQFTFSLRLFLLSFLFFGRVKRSRRMLQNTLNGLLMFWPKLTDK